MHALVSSSVGMMTVGAAAGSVVAVAAGAWVGAGVAVAAGTSVAAGFFAASCAAVTSATERLGAKAGCTGAGAGDWTREPGADSGDCAWAAPAAAAITAAARKAREKVSIRGPEERWRMVILKNRSPAGSYRDQPPKSNRAPPNRNLALGAPLDHQCGRLLAQHAQADDHGNHAEQGKAQALPQHHPFGPAVVRAQPHERQGAQGGSQPADDRGIGGVAQVVEHGDRHEEQAVHRPGKAAVAAEENDQVAARARNLEHP
ncbi:hypothetical protein G6F22_016853 [Rhizopus arrhizus]|nr:hypothetical protein G6F22_016853 [Rhizopus arrhizus]